jgi:UDP-3-O-[3-hydroxymyristoyl] N-acetylglucosamine deacetylase
MGQSESSLRQTTLRHHIGCVGVGIHSGARVAVTLRPAGPGDGIRFVRIDRAERPMIPGTLDAVVQADACIVLGNAAGARIAAVEHLMAAFALCDIDNAVVEVSGPEIPVLDGSASPFTFLIECAGRVEQEELRSAVELDRGGALSWNDAEISLTPADELHMESEVGHYSPVIERQRLALGGPVELLKTDLAAARDVVLGPMPAGVVPPGPIRIDASGVLNPEGLRFDDEVARHDLLDTLGALRLLGVVPAVRLSSRDAGHAIRIELLRVVTGRPGAGEAVPHARGHVRGAHQRSPMAALASSA